MPLTDTDRTFLREVDARERAAIKAFTTGEGTVEMAAKALSDVLRLRALIDLLAGEQVHAYWKLSPLPGRPLRAVCSRCGSEGLLNYDLHNAVMYYCHHCGTKMDRKGPDDG